MAVPRLRSRLHPSGIISIFINERYWGDANTRKQLILWLSIGMLLRALLMPFTASNTARSGLSAIALWLLYQLRAVDHELNRNNVADQP